MRAPQLFTFLEHCEDSSLEKEILECGAGIWPSLEPLFVRFQERGYVVHGIDISPERLAAAQQYCTDNHLDVDLRQGDMRQLPFDDRSISFVYAYNTIFHMRKSDVAVAMQEIERVLKPGGLCFVNFLSHADCGFGTGERVGDGEYAQIEAGEAVIHSYYDAQEAELYFAAFDLLHKENRLLERWFEDGERLVQGYIDYIGRKRAVHD
ncbi:MAG: class I SAM-dependent methyltransferase [Chloroflexota bacterium]